MIDASPIIEHFGSIPATAKAFGISPRAVYKWTKTGLPEDRVYEAHYKTGGAIPLPGEER